MSPEIVNALGDLREYRGKQDLYQATRQDVLDSLEDGAKIQSISGSNKIENISTTDKRLREIVQDKIQPKSHDEREIAGYRFVLDLVHSNFAGIDVTPNVILQLHRDLYRFTNYSFGGSWKDADNVIGERAEDGEMVTRFTPTSAAATPGAIKAICDEYNAIIKGGVYDPLLASLVFTFDFVSIHPFNDGNGRMARLLTLLLLYRNSYTVGRYISIEQAIKQTVETYYEVLKESSTGWQDGKNDYQPYVMYMLGILVSCYKDLDERFAALASSGTGEDKLRSYFEHLSGSVTKYEIMDAYPTLSQRTIERALKKLQDEGLVEKIGAARSTAYRKRQW